MTPWTPSLPVHHQLPELTQIHVHKPVMPSSHLILCHSLLLLSVFPSIRVFSSESVLHICEVASNPPKSQGMTRDTEHRGSCLASSGFWSRFGFSPSVWPISTSASPLVQKTLLLSTLKIYFSLYKVGGVGEKQPFSVPTLSPLSSGNKVLKHLRKLRLLNF